MIGARIERSMEVESEVVAGKAGAWCEYGDADELDSVGPGFCGGGNCERDMRSILRGR